jgi:hypothetical protein|tara:strand:- start:8 stop:241 length:234 start_codon:yes stop_codon:yes gene_type:complete
MNIVTKSSLLLIATLITGLISVQSHANVFGGSGPYVMMPYGERPHIIWMLNTETGEIRKCMEQMKPDPPKCGPWSEE